MSLGDSVIPGPWRGSWDNIPGKYINFHTENLVFECIELWLLNSPQIDRGEVVPNVPVGGG